MCRNIKKLYNFEPPATNDEVRAAATQYVRKISGFQNPSATNVAAFEKAINEIAHASQHLLEDLITQAAPRDRDDEAAKAKVRSARRFGTI